MFGLGRNKGKAIRRILVVEDEPLVAFDNEHVLSDAGYEVIATVDTAEEAAGRIATGGIDLVVSDVQLAGAGSGIDVARAARAAGIPVLLVTGNCPPEARTLATGSLAKPYSQRELLGAIGAIGQAANGKVTGKLPRGLTLFDDD